MNKKHLLLTLFLLLLLTTTALAMAPPPGLEVNWWVLSGGGGPADASPLHLDGSMGQGIIGHTESGALALDWGYWPEQPSRIFQPIILK